MFGILCVKEIDSKKKAFPILVKYGIENVFRTWKTLEDAKIYAKNIILCKTSETYFINFENGEMIKSI